MNEEERIFLYQSRPSWLNYIYLYIAGIILFIFFANMRSADIGTLVLIVLIILSIILRYRYLYTITDHRIIMRVGLIARNTNEIVTRHIRAINVRQSIVERLLDIGTIEFSTAAGEGIEVRFKGIREPYKVKNVVKGNIDGI